MAGQKGNNFEREVCRRLSLWWTDGEDDDCFWRNKLRRTNKAYNAQMQEGDIIATKEIAIPFTERFTIECKSGYSHRKKTNSKKPSTTQMVKNVPWDLLDLVDGNRKDPTILKFWYQAEDAGNLTGKTPILIFKRDFHEPTICINNDLAKELTITKASAPMALESLGYTINLHYSEGTLWFFNLEKFLTVFSSIVFKGMMGRV